LKILAADIETGSAKELHSAPYDYLRLFGWKIVGSKDPVTISTDPREFIAALMDADAITFHNGINFDVMALAKHADADYEDLCRKMFDTLIVERHLNPVAAQGAQPNGYYKLDPTAARYGVAGKSTVDFDGKREIVRRVRGDKVADKLKRGKTDSFGVLDLLSDLYGGYHLISQDDPDYVEYLRRDVLAQEALSLAQSRIVNGLSAASQRYIRREHATQSAMGRVTLEGFRNDVDETMRRHAAGQARLEAGKQKLHTEYGMPLEGKFPHRSNPGKAAFRNALLDTGISERALHNNWPRGKDGFLLTGKEVLAEMIAVFDRAKPSAAELCRTIMAMNGERSIYGTILDHLVDGRVHPYIGPDQSSGRWSMKDPGLTVFGKRGGKARERGIMLAEEGEVLVAIDADQIDARMIAALSQDPEYLKLFGPGIDLHSEVSFRVWSDMSDHGGDCHDSEKPGCDCGMIRKCHCVLRDRAKVFGHGFNYGMGANGMAKQHGVDPAVAQSFVAGMEAAFPRLAAWKNEMRVAAGMVGYGEEVPSDDSFRVLHTLFGRPVRVERSRAYTQACAQLGQGSTRDGMAEAILKLPFEIRRRIKAVVHDEIVLSLPEEGAQEAAQAIADGMAFDARGVRISFGVSQVDKCWAGTYGDYCSHRLAA
jgi:DNA polymerase-1